MMIAFQVFNVNLKSIRDYYKWHSAASPLLVVAAFVCAVNEERRETENQKPQYYSIRLIGKT